MRELLRLRKKVKEEKDEEEEQSKEEDKEDAAVTHGYLHGWTKIHSLSKVKCHQQSESCHQKNIKSTEKYV